MLRSMTGFGESYREADGIAVSVEVRAVNNRYLKCNVRLSDGYAALESRVETRIKRAVQRGTISASIRIDREKSPDDYEINLELLTFFHRRLIVWAEEQGIAARLGPEHLLAVPGVFQEKDTPRADHSLVRPLVDAAVDEALEGLVRMREEEGAATTEDFRLQLSTISERLDAVAERAPGVVDDYRDRLNERIASILAEKDIVLDPADLLREVSVFAERSDISEEIARLRSHLEQFEQLLSCRESLGRKLEFVTQEMFRETNTIGSKGNDVEIAKAVIDVKAAIERIREQVQNIE